MDTGTLRAEINTELIPIRIEGRKLHTFRARVGVDMDVQTTRSIKTLLAVRTTMFLIISGILHDSWRGMKRVMGPSEILWRRVW